MYYIEYALACLRLLRIDKASNFYNNPETILAYFCYFFANSLTNINLDLTITAIRSFQLHIPMFFGGCVSGG